MSEISVLDLPLMAYAELTANDRVLVIDDGILKQFTWENLLTFIQSNVQGEKGDQGVAGTNGTNGINGTNGADGADGLSAYELAVNAGFSGTIQQWLDSLVGAAGADGADGSNGWTPNIAIVADGERRVVQVLSWSNGSGTPPTTGYLGSTGIVTDIAQATNIRGIQGVQGIQGATGATGAQGIQGIQGNAGTSAYQLAVLEGFVGTESEWLASLVGATGATGAAGADGLSVTDIDIATNGSITLTMSDTSTIVSNTPNTTTGFAKYIDTQYVGATTLAVASATTVVLPNNKGTVVETRLPTGVTTFYNGTVLQLADTAGMYEVTISFTVKAATQADPMKLTIHDNADAVIFTEDFFVTGQSRSTTVNIKAHLVGSSQVASGLTVKVAAQDYAQEIVDISYTICKIF